MKKYFRKFDTISNYNNYLNDTNNIEFVTPHIAYINDEHRTTLFNKIQVFIDNFASYPVNIINTTTNIIEYNTANLDTDSIFLTKNTKYQILPILGPGDEDKANKINYEYFYIPSDNNYWLDIHDYLLFLTEFKLKYRVAYDGVDDLTPEPEYVYFYLDWDGIDLLDANGMTVINEKLYQYAIDNNATHYMYIISSNNNYTLGVKNISTDEEYTFAEPITTPGYVETPTSSDLDDFARALLFKKSFPFQQTAVPDIRRFDLGEYYLNGEVTICLLLL